MPAHFEEKHPLPKNQNTLNQPDLRSISWQLDDMGDKLLRIPIRFFKDNNGISDNDFDI